MNKLFKLISISSMIIFMSACSNEKDPIVGKKFRLDYDTYNVNYGDYTKDEFYEDNIAVSNEPNLISKLVAKITLNDNETIYFSDKAISQNAVYNGGNYPSYAFNSVEKDGEYESICFYAIVGSTIHLVDYEGSFGVINGKLHEFTSLSIKNSETASLTFTTTNIQFNEADKTLTSVFVCKLLTAHSTKRISIKLYWDMVEENA